MGMRGGASTNASNRKKGLRRQELAKEAGWEDSSGEGPIVRRPEDWKTLRGGLEKKRGPKEGLTDRELKWGTAQIWEGLPGEMRDHGEKRDNLNKQLTMRS